MNVRRTEIASSISSTTKITRLQEGSQCYGRKEGKKYEKKEAQDEKEKYDDLQFAATTDRRRRLYGTTKDELMIAVRTAVQRMHENTKNLRNRTTSCCDLSPESWVIRTARSG